MIFLSFQNFQKHITNTKTCPHLFLIASIYVVLLIVSMVREMIRVESQLVIPKFDFGSTSRPSSCPPPSTKSNICVPVGHGENEPTDLDRLSTNIDGIILPNVV